MNHERIKVITYSGYRGEERPSAFFLFGERVGIVEIMRMWIEEGIEDRERKRFFKVKGSDGVVHMIYYNEKTLEWFYA